MDQEVFCLEKATPMMRQWHECKQKAGSALLLFRMGDFYEAFYEDADTLSSELDLALTKRQSIPMSGIPVQSVEGYVDKLVSKGYRVAIAEQTEDAKQAQGLVRRELVRIVTAGTLTHSSLLQENAHNFIASFTQVGSLYGLAILDITTAEFFTLELEGEGALQDELQRWQPAELIVSNRFAQKNGELIKRWRLEYPFSIQTYDDWHFEHKQAHERLIQHFAVASLDGFGLQGKVAAINAAGALVSYLTSHLKADLTAVRAVKSLANSQFMALDRATQRHLQLLPQRGANSRDPTLFDALNATKSAMGARLLRRWLLHPLLSAEAIAARQDAIEELLRDERHLEELQRGLEGLRDIERLLMRIATFTASPRDLLSLRSSLERVPFVIDGLRQTRPQSALLQQILANLCATPNLAALLQRALLDELPQRVGDAPLFRPGYNSELDLLRSFSCDSQEWLNRYQAKLRDELAIKTLKVGYSRTFGYYIEVSHGHAHKVPSALQRRQTMTNGERFITAELKDFEDKVLNAQEKSSSIERALYRQLLEEAASHTAALQKTAEALALIDVFASLAQVALQRNYCRPMVDHSQLLKIEEGRHPIVEQYCARAEFTPNDTFFDEEKERLLLLTGPNMAGKSTYLRQVALIVLMAQIGSFVPAKKVRLGVIDKIFTRIGASDDLARGQSTFMVEMNETANILHNATSRSLVLLDEIGRGTSTYDGISIAWAVAEYLLTTPGKCAKTLFATHYWELTQLEGVVAGAVNYSVAVHEADGEIRFIHKIKRGGADKSYGIHVGRLAGLPATVLKRAYELLERLEATATAQRFFVAPPLPKKAAAAKSDGAYQLSFFDPL